ncbi:hypothetical protein [Priestia megaterium]|uniref:hypothetical protein n=1 Tax=Priestia megaterium TaxID=1404 RepID=UPI002E220249|nr:hypothetical protein [Priestia megaterium]
MARRQRNEAFSDFMFGAGRREEREREEWERLFKQIDEIVLAVEELAPLLKQFAPLVDLFSKQE